MMNGLLNVKKPCGMSSRWVVDQVHQHLQKQLGRKIKVGHSGTLDPFADGVLVLGIGRSTGLLRVLQHGKKRYQGTFQLGCTSPSLDLESPVETVHMPSDLSREQIDQILPDFTGKIQQIPPRHSAVKVDGKRAYRRARAGESFQMPSRTVNIHHLRIVEFQSPHLVLDVLCSGGTYIRTLGQDIGRRLNTDAVMTKLTRTESCGIDLATAHDLTQLLARPISADDLLTPYRAMQHLPGQELDDHECQRLANGLITYSLQEKLAPLASATNGAKSPVMLAWQQQLAGLVYWQPAAELGEGKWKLLVNLANDLKVANQQSSI